MTEKTKSKWLEQPLAEVFGFPSCNFTEEAERFRKNKLCPFNNRVPSCTKDKAKDPLGVCSVVHEANPVITCPIRFRQNWVVVEDAAQFFFTKKTSWTSLTEVRLEDKNGKSAGNIDIVLVAYNDKGRVIDFGSLEVQAVYISGNIRTPFEHYTNMADKVGGFVWKGKPNYPKPDFLSSSRKRLVPQILYKGGIIKTWGKKQVIALQKSFFETLPDMPQVKEGDADIAWFLYDLETGKSKDRYELVRKDAVYTKFEPALNRIVNPHAGRIDEFIGLLQEKLDEKLEGTPPDAPTLTDTILS